LLLLLVMRGVEVELELGLELELELELEVEVKAEAEAEAEATVEVDFVQIDIVAAVDEFDMEDEFALVLIGPTLQSKESRVSARRIHRTLQIPFEWNQLFQL